VLEVLQQKEHAAADQAPIGSDVVEQSPSQGRIPWRRLQIDVAGTKDEMQARSGS
jgi:hypothetical protein